jgi:hypothetical protein
MKRDFVLNESIVIVVAVNILILKRLKVTVYNRISSFFFFLLFNNKKAKNTVVLKSFSNIHIQLLYLHFFFFTLI